jgi:peptidoglycan/LPS O-acetylase OafA/YrhL
MSGILSTLYISKYIELNQIKLSMILQFFGKHSLFIFIWHMFILYFVHSMMIKAFGSKDMEFTYIFQGVKFIISILLLIVGISLYEKLKLRRKNV